MTSPVKAMDMQRAIEILGINNTKGPLQNMVRALSMMAWRNTPAENERRQAAGYVLRRWSAYQKECNDARSSPLSRR